MQDISFMSPDYIEKVVNAISNGIGDDYTIALRKQKIREEYSNAKANLKWDLINRNLKMEFLDTKVISAYTKRRIWHMVPFFDRETEILYMAMREKRLLSVRKEKPKRKSPHYLDACTKIFNFDVWSPNRQMDFFDTDQFEDEQVIKVVDGILNDMVIPKKIIKHFALVLFDEVDNELVSVRCCILDSDLEIAEQQNWSKYIKHVDSAIVDVDENVNTSQEDTSINLGLKKKAKNKSEHKHEIERKQAQEEKKAFEKK